MVQKHFYCRVTCIETHKNCGSQLLSFGEKILHFLASRKLLKVTFGLELLNKRRYPREVDNKHQMTWSQRLLPKFETVALISNDSLPTRCPKSCFCIWDSQTSSTSRLEDCLDSVTRELIRALKFIKN